MRNGTVLAYDETGNRKVPTPVSIGDEIDWKRQGTRGSFRCRVYDVREDQKGRTRLAVLVLSHDGRQITHMRRSIIGHSVMRVYHQE